MHSCMLSLWGGWRRCFCLSRLLTNGPVHSTAAGQHLCLQLARLPRVFLQCLQLLGQMCLAQEVEQVLWRQFNELPHELVQVKSL